MLLHCTLQFQIIRGGGEREGGKGFLIKRNLNINKRGGGGDGEGGGPNKRGGSENCSRSEVATRYH